jgi:hypothetical protein
MKNCTIYYRSEVGGLSSLIKRGTVKTFQAKEDDISSGSDTKNEFLASDDDSITNDTLRATILKSKKVLAKQQDILRQVSYISLFYF